MNVSLQRIETVGDALRTALHDQDWSVVAELDQLCRQAVEDAMDGTVSDEEELRTHMETLLEVYRELVSACQNEQRRLASEMIQMNQSKQGAKVYQLFG